MQQIQLIQQFEQIKILADPRRLAILRLLMAKPATLSQLGESLGEHPAWIRHHIKQLEAANLVSIIETRITNGVVEKFYKASAPGFLLQELILPGGEVQPCVVFSGSHDPAFEQLAASLAPHLNILSLPVGSLDGLVNLRQGISHFSGSHLLDTSGEYNLPFVRHFFPDRQVHVVTLAYREQGLMLAPGNPKSIQRMQDLAQPGIRFINRNPGSGTRLWLDQALQTHGIPVNAVSGYEKIVNTHTASAQAIFEGAADAAIGVRAAAHLYDLEFIPLFHERYDLVIPHEYTQLLNPILDALQTNTFRHTLENLTGYETRDTGKEIKL